MLNSVELKFWRKFELLILFYDLHQLTYLIRRLLSKRRLYCVYFSGGNYISGSVVERVVRSGDNITLYCNCKTSSKEFLVWYRNCTHDNQPSLVLKLEEDSWKSTTDQATLVNSLSRFHFVKNQSSGSYDLLIINISYSDEGLYYCGIGMLKVEQTSVISLKYIYRYGSITTRILISKCCGVIYHYYYFYY